MAVNMTFFANFSKRENSTKQPSGGTTYNVTFKDTFSPYTGGVVLLNASYSTLKTYTEALYDNMYYTIEDIKIVSNNHCEIDLKLDLLATYKSNIASMTCLIERSPSDANQSMYNDALVSPRLDYSIVMYYRSSFSHIINDRGASYKVVTDNDKGILAFYLNDTALNELLSDANFWGYSQYIRSVSICPFSPSFSGGTATQNVWLGNNNAISITGSGTSCWYVAAQQKRTICKEKLDISTNILSDLIYTDFRRYDNNYVQVTCEMCGITVPIDSRFLKREYIKYEVEIDNITLDAECSLYVGNVVNGSDTDYLITKSSVNVGLSTNFAQTASAIERLGSLASLSNSINGTVVNSIVNPSSLIPSGNDAASGIVNSYRSFHNTISNVNQIGSTGGSILSWYDVFDDIKVNVITFGSTPKNPLDFGYPYFEITNINTVGLNGFYKLMASEVDLAAPEFIKLDILNKITNGFFYE